MRFLNRERERWISNLWKLSPRIFPIFGIFLAGVAQAQVTNPPVGSRPYILLTTDRLANVVAKMNANDLGWQKFIAQVNGHQGTGWYEPYGWIAGDALAFRATGNTQYLADAQSKFNEYYASWNYTDGSGLTYQWTCRHLCMAYDWLYTNLPPAVRDTWRNKIRDAALYWQPLCYPKNYNSGISYRDTDHVSFLMENMLLSGLCLYGDDTNATTFINTHDDVRTSVVIPNLYSNFYNGGYIWSGTMYGPEELKHVFRPLVVNLKARGIPLPANFHDPCLKSLLLQTFPGYEGQVEYGDMHLGNWQPAGWSSEAFPPYAAFQSVCMLRWMSANPVLRNHAQFWLNRYESLIDRDYILNAEPWALESMLYQDAHNTVATNPATTGETLVDFAPSGYVSMRSSWNDNATALYFHNSEWNVDHQHMDCGHYTIVRNKRPVTSDLSGYWGGGYPACQDTIAHNAILVENAAENDGQTGTSLDTQAGVTDTAVDYDDQFGYVRGEYAPAYNFTGWNGTDMSGRHVLTNALRKIFWVKPDLFVIHDYIRLQTNQPPRWKKFIHHFQGQPSNTAGGVISCLSDSNRCLFKAVLPVGGTISTTKEDTIFLNFAQDGIMDGQKNWFIAIDAGNGSATQEFLNVLFLTDSNSVAPMPTVTTFTGSSGVLRGTQIQTAGAGIVWLCRNGPGRTNRADYAIVIGAEPVLHVLTDFPTGATLFARATPGAGTLTLAVSNNSFTGATPVQSSLQGTIKFITRADGSIASQLPALVPNTINVTNGLLQTAIDAATPSGVVKVAAGVYAENVHVGKPLTILGGYSPIRDWTTRNPTQFVTTVQGANTGPVFRFDDTYQLTIDGFRVTGGQRGFEMTQNIWPIVIRDNTISGNVIEQNGLSSGDPYFFGGAMMLRGSNAVVIGNTIRSNSAGKGGAIGMSSATNWLIANNLIERNWIYSDHGGSMYLSGVGRLIGNTIRFNRSGDIAGYGWGGAFTTDHMIGEIASNSIYGNFVQSSGNVHIDEASVVSFHHNLVVSNRSATSAAGLRVGREGSSGPGSFVNLSFCTIANNTSPGDQNAINLDASDTTLTNCIIWGNGANPLGTDNTGSNIVAWSIVDVPYNGNLTNDPLFASISSGDYHVKSTAGRWNPATQSWVTDATNSPAIDTADPASPFANEPAPNGGTANLGAYGNTPEASKSADTDGDGLSDSLERFRAKSSPTTANSDADTANDWSEYIAGTSPTNSADWPRLDSVASLGTNTQLSWSGKINRRYRVAATTNLFTGAWSSTGSTVTGQQVQIFYTHTNAATPALFYRLEIQWP